MGGREPCKHTQEKTILSDFKDASQCYKPKKKLEHLIKKRLGQIPKTREGRMASILATIQAHPEGLNLQPFVNRLVVTFATKRKTIEEMFHDLERARFIRINRKLKVVPILKEAEV